MVLPYTDMNPPWVYLCSTSWTPLLTPSPSHPSGSSQCTSPEHPVSCIEPGLVIHFTYDNLHVSMPFSHIIPPSPSPRVQKTIQYICVSLAVSHTGLSLPSYLYSAEGSLEWGSGVNRGTCWSSPKWESMVVGTRVVAIEIEQNGWNEKYFKGKMDEICWWLRCKGEGQWEIKYSY